MTKSDSISIGIKAIQLSLFILNIFQKCVLLHMSYYILNLFVFVCLKRGMEWQNCITDSRLFFFAFACRASAYFQIFFGGGREGVG